MDPGAGRVTWEVSADQGKTWAALPADRKFNLPAVEQARTLVLRVTLAQGPDRATPLVRNVRLVVGVPVSAPDLDPVAGRFAFAPPRVELVPATWNGARFRDGAWSLARAIQPAGDGRLWMDAVDADVLDICPGARSWIESVEGSASGKALRQGMWNRNFLSFDLDVPRPGPYGLWLRVRLARDRINPDYHPSVVVQVDHARAR